MKGSFSCKKYSFQGDVAPWRGKSWFVGLLHKNKFNGMVEGRNMRNQTTDGTSRHETLRKMLLAKRAEIWARIREELAKKIGEDIDSVLGPALDEGDLSTLEAGRDLDYELLNLSNKKLRDINEVLDRLDEGTYGVCEECGENIGEKRLRVMPFARCCVKCQREREMHPETDRGRVWIEKRVQTRAAQNDQDEGLDDD